MLGLGSFFLASQLVKSLANRTNRQYLPEPFLWDTFYHLVETAMAMENGLKDGGGDFEIVHRDIKPANSKSLHVQSKPFRIITQQKSVFLGKENPRKGLPFYPIAKLGDFGLAVTTNHNDGSNPHDYLGAGTSGYLAPVSAEILQVR